MSRPTISPRLARGREGMTYVELLVALLIASLVVMAAMSFFKVQGDALAIGTAKTNVVQNYRFALSTLSRDLRTAGSNVPAHQPFLVYAGEDVVAFNADYVSDDANELYSVYVDTTADAAAAHALRRADRFTLPRTTFAYPDTTYLYKGNNSGAETIVFYFEPDATTPRNDDFVLYRQVNRQPPGVVARNLLRTPGRPFLEYLREVDTSAGKVVQAVPAASLPLRHSVKIHGAPADTGAAAAIDRVRGVRLTVTATNGLAGTREQRRTATRTVRMANAGMAVLQLCGEEPAFGSALTAFGVVLPDGSPAVELRWSAAADEAAGEEDVLRYLIWRRRTGESEWGDPYLSIPAGRPAYAYVDEAVTPGTSYDYGIAAQDCSPSLSGRAEAGGVAAPIP